MAGLPKKYAKMGFAKGWRAYKASKKSSSRRVVKTTTTKRRKSYTMARRKRKSYSRKKSMFTGPMGLMLGGAGYGMIRGPLNSVTKMIPLPVIGSLGDEVALGVASYFLATKGKGLVKKIGQAGLVIESHNLTRNMSGGLFAQKTAVSSNNVF